MLRLAMLSLIFSASCGVFGFGGGASSSWVWGQILFLVFLLVAAFGFLGGLRANSRGLREAPLNDRSSYGWPAKDSHGTDFEIS
jgi:uncharacterized membrane protein YtjA (UPF0391 family)